RQLFGMLPLDGFAVPMAVAISGRLRRSDEADGQTECRSDADNERRTAYRRRAAYRHRRALKNATQRNNPTRPAVRYEPPMKNSYLSLASGPGLTRPSMT